MANIKGPGSMKAVNLIAVTYPNNVTKDGKSRYMDVQIDARDSRGPEQTNLHLVTERVKHDGKDRINNGAPYSAAQFDAIKEAAGANVVTLPSGAEVYAVKADLMPSSRKTGLVLNLAGWEIPSRLTWSPDGHAYEIQIAVKSKSIPTGGEDHASRRHPCTYGPASCRHRQPNHRQRREQQQARAGQAGDPRDRRRRRRSALCARQIARRGIPPQAAARSRSSTPKSGRASQSKKSVSQLRKIAKISRAQASHGKLTWSLRPSRWNARWTSSNSK